MIEFNDVSFSYNKNEKCVKNINLQIKSGEFILLSGKSGCGKSTLLNIISGIIPKHIKGELLGKVTIDEKDISKMTIQDISRSVGSVFQNPKSQFFHLNTSDEVLFSASNKGLEKEELSKRFSNIVKLFSLEKLIDRNIFDLSGGEKQKIACASTCAGYPKILVFDEPSSNLDHETINEYSDILRELKRQGYTIIIAEHRLYYLMDICDKVIYMENGEIKKKYKKDEFVLITDDDRKKLGLRAVKTVEIDRKISDINSFDNQLYDNISDDEKTDIHLKNSNQNSKKKCNNRVEIKDLKYNYAKKNILDIKYLNMISGESIAIIGRNGTGKSTFAKCLCGLKKSNGIYINGKKCKEKERNKKFNLVMQDVNHQLFTETVLDEMLLDFNKKEKNSKEYAEEILSELDLLDFKDRHPLALSGGQKQRLIVGTTIIAERNICILDEPTSGLDYEHMEKVSELINKLKSKGIIVIIISHDYEFINMCCDRVIKFMK